MRLLVAAISDHERQSQLLRGKRTIHLVRTATCDAKIPKQSQHSCVSYCCHRFPSTATCCANREILSLKYAAKTRLNVLLNFEHLPWISAEVSQSKRTAKYETMRRIRLIFLDTMEVVSATPTQPIQRLISTRYRQRLH